MTQPNHAVVGSAGPAPGLYPAVHRDHDGKVVRWREGRNLPPGRLRLVGPHDPDARCGVKRGMVWNGYKVHYSETCDQDLPHLVVNVATTHAAVDDSTQVQPVHDALARRGLSSGEHLVDGGYISAAIVLAARADGIRLVGPLPPASERQTHEGSFALTDFQIHGDERYALCPRGAKGRYWGHARVDGHPAPSSSSPSGTAATARPAPPAPPVPLAAWPCAHARSTNSSNTNP